MREMGLSPAADAGERGAQPGFTVYHGDVQERCNFHGGETAGPGDSL